MDPCGTCDGAGVYCYLVPECCGNPDDAYSGCCGDPVPIEHADICPACCGSGTTEP